MRFLNTALGVANDVDGPAYRFRDFQLLVLYVCSCTRYGRKLEQRLKERTDAQIQAEAAWFLAFNSASNGEEPAPTKSAVAYAPL